MDDNKINTFANMINKSQYIVFFGGAGVSTESGIPDFRSKDGLYNQHDVQFDNYTPEYLLSHSCLYNDSKVFYEFYRQKLNTYDIEPNKAHYFLTKLETMGKLKAIITQNIDGLHQKAGSKKVYEIHGTTYRNYCDTCHKQYPQDYIFKSKEDIPHCKCGGMIRPDVTLYEEGLPIEAVNNSINALRKADMLIIGGTSLTVYPAASYIREFHGKYLVVINRDSLRIKLRENDLEINDSIGKVFEELEKKMGI